MNEAAKHYEHVELTKTGSFHLGDPLGGPHPVTPSLPTAWCWDVSLPWRAHRCGYGAGAAVAGPSESNRQPEVLLQGEVFFSPDANKKRSWGGGEVVGAWWFGCGSCMVELGFQGIQGIQGNLSKFV